MKRALIVVAVALLVAVGLRIGSALMRPVDDRALIREAVAKAVQDSRDGNPGSVVDLISRDLKINDEGVGGDRGAVTKFIRNSRPDVTIERPEPVITGTEARIVSPVNLKAELLGNKVERRLGEVTLILRKEEGKDWLLMPKPSWKLVEVRVPETSVADLFAPGL